MINLKLYNKIVKISVFSLTLMSSLGAVLIATQTEKEQDSCAVHEDNQSSGASSALFKSFFRSVSNLIPSQPLSFSQEEAVTTTISATPLVLTPLDGGSAIIPAKTADAVVASLATLQGPMDKEMVVRITAGDTLTSLISQIGVSKDENFKAIETLKSIFDPKALKIGQTITFRYHHDPAHTENRLISLEFKTQNGNQIILKATPSSQGNTFEAKKYELELTKSLHFTEGTINTSFYGAALKKGVPAHVVKEAISALSYEVNWQHDPQSGDKFAIAYDVFKDKDGTVIKAGDLQFASFSPSGNIKKIYRYQPKSGGAAGYYNNKGESVVKCLLQTPLDPTRMRVTSRFGVRKHPIQGYCKQHKGVDFGAPNGTPVMSAGDGVIVKAGWWGAYGNYVLVKHNNEYSTAYAHLSKINVKIGDRVRQRQVIGAVGATGRTTGAHLHYEVICKGQHVNPQTIKQLPAVKLSSKDFNHFIAVAAAFDEKTNIPSVRNSSLLKEYALDKEKIRIG